MQKSHNIPKETTCPRQHQLIKQHYCWKHFFPSLPIITEDHAEQSNLNSLPLPNLTMDEVQVAIMEASPHKAPRNDGLVATVWSKLWPVINVHVISLFQSFLNKGIRPHRWKKAKIIPLQKPGRPIRDYTLASSYRPISLLCILGKALEAIITSRISYMVEEYGLVPSNHLGRKKHRSAVQALVIVQEQIWKAWQSRKILILVGFDIKGAYNGVSKIRLLRRLAARRIPQQLIAWVDNFCSERTATITVFFFFPSYFTSSILPATAYENATSLWL